MAGTADVDPVEVEASLTAERGVARWVSRPLGLVAAVVGGGLALAGLAQGAFAWAVAWALLGCWGLAAHEVGAEAAELADD